LAALAPKVIGGPCVAASLRPMCRQSAKSAPLWRYLQRAFQRGLVLQQEFLRFAFVPARRLEQTLEFAQRACLGVASSDRVVAADICANRNSSGSHRRGYPDNARSSAEGEHLMDLDGSGCSHAMRVWPHR
jgi:hypothetical protein